MVRAGPIMALPTVLRSFGIDASELLAESGLNEAFFGDPENTLEMTLAGRLLGRCAARTGCEHFGLLVGQHAGGSALGVLGFLMQSSETVGDALAAFARHLEVQDRGGTVSFEIDGDYCTLGYTLFDAEVESLDQIMGCAIAIAANLLRNLCGPQWQPHAVLFAFSRPKDVEPYRQFFGVQPQFDAERTGIVLPKQLLHTPVPSADKLLHKLMQERIRELEATTPDEAVARLRRMLRTMVTSSEFSVGAAANRMGMHVRKLNRELAAAGTSFSKMREEARRELACQLLKSTRTAINEISAILGYTDPASFTRAFQRWTGSTPTPWRAGRQRRPPR